MRRKEEVCGKPTQYNLQTLQYDWKELPDTHFAFGGNNRRQAGPQAPYATDAPHNSPTAQIKQASTGVTVPKRSFPETYGYSNDSPEGNIIDYSHYMQWSHEDIRQLLRNNISEVSRSYVGVNSSAF